LHKRIHPIREAAPTRNTIARDTRPRFILRLTTLALSRERRGAPPNDSPQLSAPLVGLQRRVSRL